MSNTHISHRLVLRVIAASACLAIACVDFFAGSALAKPEPLHIQRISPNGDHVRPAQEIVFQFDRPMVKLGDMHRNAAAIPITITPKLACQWRWLDTTELTCRLPGQATFRPATHYRIKVHKSITALDGTHLAHAVKRDFTTWRPRVTYSRFQRWRSPVEPVYLVRFNLPVTRRQTAEHLTFTNKTAPTVGAHAEPFKKKRKGPLWLALPGSPGAMIFVERPKPNTPIDQQKLAGQARRQWLVSPAKPLKPAEKYTLSLSRGLKSPLGPLGDNDTNMPGHSFQTYGPFQFTGAACEHPKKQSPKCRPTSVKLGFSAPVPRATLAAARWRPAPISQAQQQRAWQGYRVIPDPLSRSALGGESPATYILPFDLAANSHYRVTVPAGVKDDFGRTLKKARTVIVETGHRRPFFDPPPREAVLEAGEPTIVPLGFINLDTLTFHYHGLTVPPPAKPPHALSAADEINHALGLDFATREQSPIRLIYRAKKSTQSPHRQIDVLKRPGLANRHDRIITEPLGIRAMLGGRSGVVWGKLRASAVGEPYIAAHDGRDFLGEVTPFEVFTKIGHFNSLVWVKNFATGQPIANARVTLMHGTSQHLARWQPADRMHATTNAQGLAVLPGSQMLPGGWLDGLSDHQQYFVKVIKKDNIGVLPLDWSFKRSIGQVSDYDADSDRQPKHGHLRTWAVTEQGLYKPGGNVRFAVFARDVSNTRLVAPPRQKYTVIITDSGQNTVFNKDNISLSRFGGVHGHYHVPKTARHGSYTIYLAWKNTSGEEKKTAGHFLVTDFVPASFKVYAAIQGKRFKPGDSAAATARATLHAGGPYNNAKVKFLTRVERQRFDPTTPASKDFIFDANPDDAPASQTIAQQAGRLNHAGETKTRFTLPRKTGIHYGRVMFQASVQSARGSWVAHQATAGYTARNRFVGLRRDGWLLHAGKPATVHYLVVNPNGQPKAGTTVEIALQRQAVSRVRVKDAAGRFTTQTTTHWKTVDHCAATSADKPGACQLKPDNPGRYRFRARIDDTQGRAQTTTIDAYATGPGGVTWQPDRSVRMIADRSSYQPGQTAHVLIQNPYQHADALVTIERYGVLWKKIVHLYGGAPVIDVPIKPSYFPGAYLSITLFSPRVAQPGPPDLGRPEIAMGYTPLKIVGTGSSMHVDVAADKKIHKPRQSAHVNVDVKNKHGNKKNGHGPGQTRLVAIAVDQAVVDLLRQGNDYYDPRKTFYAPPDGADMANYSLAEQLLTRLEPKWGKGENPGGGGGTSKGPDTRHIFKYSAYWNPNLTTDANGHAQFAFKLPDNLTRWRIFVIALSPGQAMGVGATSVRTNLPIQINPALPNQVHVGDDVDAGFSINNRTQQSQKIKTSIKAQGPIDGHSASTETTLQLGSYEHKLAWLHLDVNAPGAIDLSARATAGDLGDAIDKQISVTRAAAPIVAAQYGSTKGARKSVSARVPKNAARGSASVTVALSPTLIGNLTGAFKTLRDDKLQDWETRLSRGMLAADFSRLKPIIGDSLRWPDAQKLVRKLLLQAADFQAPNGGMAFFIPRNKFVSRYLSVYTAIAFNRLHSMGYAIDDQVQARLHDYLRGHILGWSAKKGTDAADAAPILKAGALAALAPTGTLKPGRVAALMPRLSRLSLFGQALLLEAALDTGDTHSAKRLAKSILSHAEESAGSISFNEARHGSYLDLLATPLRANCAVLDALVRYKKNTREPGLIGDTPEKAMRWINGQRQSGGGWPNSQENVFCTTAIEQYADAFEPEVRHLTGRVKSAGQTLGTAAFDSRAAPAKTIEGKAAQPGQDFHIAVEHGGRGRLYYQMRLQYAVPPMSVASADAGLSVKRAYYVRQNKQWQKIGANTTLTRGDIVRVDLTVDAPTERHHLVLTDPLPGAFEAVNQRLATSPKHLPAAKPGATVLMFNYGAWPNGSIVDSGFYHRSTDFNAVRFYARDLMAGHYHLVYTAQVIAPGTFIAPAPEIKQIYQPDVFGRGKAVRLHVAKPSH